ncbi:Siderophore iron transporter 3 [Cyberlindnera fabianii]|uniref:Siderophore iron transporter 3 n=1 Tax=Cyberlindnera fabianii TaxID=36022 RepID=A0A1V2L9I4_CYBFA|nr:Siderophore iron transporter 3 [Cyberlindnera fabianii]
MSTESIKAPVHAASDSVSDDIKDVEQQIYGTENPVIVENESDASSVKKLYQSRGVARMEMVKATMDQPGRKGKRIRILFWIALLVISWVYTFEGATTYNYSPEATSVFGKHSMLATVDVATSIISSVSPVIIAKIADITSRPWTFGVAITMFCIGGIICSACQNVTAFTVGNVVMAIGTTGISLLTTLIAADITPLKYRGLLLGLLSTPYLINTWFTGLIVDSVLKHNWRWGYGMFCIIVPVTMIPAILLMSYLEHQAKVTQAALGNVRPPSNRDFKQWIRYLGRQCIECDLAGLLLLAFGWALLLLPLSLYTSAKNHWKNPSLIAMFIVGGILLIVYTIYELYLAPVPSMPKRILANRTFMTAVCIDFFYQCGGMIRLAYLSSYALVIFDWSYVNWTYFNNTFTMASCSFCVLVGIIQRYTHRAKYLQCFGLSLQVVAMGITYWARYDNASTVAIVWTQILIGIGGSCSVVGSQVSSQASVPHQDTALAISLLSLWSTIGQAIGSAIAGAIWQTKLPAALRMYMPSSVNDTMVATYYGSVMEIYYLPYDSVERKAAKDAYFYVYYYLSAIALGLTCIPFVVSFFQKNFYLGDDQNAIETKYITYTRAPKNIVEKVMRFCDEPFKYKEQKAKWEAAEAAEAKTTTEEKTSTN